MNILTQLRNTSSRLEKENILRTATALEKEVFFYACHQDYTYGIRFDLYSCAVTKAPTRAMFDILNRLKSRKLTGNAAYSEVHDYCKLNDCDLLYLICNRDLDCGVNAATLNKVFGKNFIPQFKVQLATEVPINECPLPCIGQLKYNGVRVIAIIEDQGVTFKTRNGKEFKYPELEKELLRARQYTECDYVLDGELTIGDSQNLSHTSVSGIVNSALRGTPITQKLTFNIFDGMPAADFQAKKCDMEYGYRFDEVRKIVFKLHSPIVDEAVTYVFKTHKDIETKFNELLIDGYEGLIIKTWRHTYNFKRSKDWIKLKAIKTADLICTDIIEGTGKYSGGIGSLICTGVVEGKQVTVDVGTGLSDEDRMYTHQSHFIGEMIEVKYNSLIQNIKTGQWSLFLPRYVANRGDL